MTDNELARKTVDEIITDLSDRRGLSGEWDQIDEPIQEKIKQEWAGIIEQALRAHRAEVLAEDWIKNLLDAASEANGYLSGSHQRNPKLPGLASVYHRLDEAVIAAIHQRLDTK